MSIDEEENWTMVSKEPIETSASVIKYNIWKGLWKSGRYPGVRGKLEILFRDNKSIYEIFVYCYFWILFQYYQLFRVSQKYP